MIVNRQTFLVLGKGWRSGEIDCLPPMWPGFKYRRRRHMWVEFVVGSLLCFKRFFSEYSGFPLSSKTNVSKFRFDQDSGRRWTTLWMCYLQIYLLFDRHPSKLVKINGQSSKLPPHWDTLFHEVLKGRFGRGVPPRRAFKPWPRLKTKIVHFSTLFNKREKRPYFMTLICSFFASRIEKTLWN